MRRALFPFAVVSLFACAAEPETRPPSTPATHPRAIHEAFVEAPKPLPAPVPDACPDRAARLAHAKSTIRAFHERIRTIVPLAKFAAEHKCEVRDTSGSVLVQRTREAGGTRIAFSHGSPAELVCNVPASSFPEGLDVDAMNTIAWLDETDMSDKLVDFGAQCHDAALEVTYGDVKKQKAILTLP